MTERGEQSAETDALAERVLVALDEYERDCDTRRRARSIEHWGHPGAHVHEESPTRDGRRRAVAAALSLPPASTDRETG